MRPISPACAVAPSGAPVGEAQACHPAQAGQPDIDEVIEYYLAEAAEQVALHFIEGLERAYENIARHPATGATRYAHELNLPGLRSWPLVRYPYVIFYMERDDYIDVWRVLHGHRDVPVWMQEPE